MMASERAGVTARRAFVAIAAAYICSGCSPSAIDAVSVQPPPGADSNTRASRTADIIRKLRSEKIIGDISCGIGSGNLEAEPGFFATEFKYKVKIAQTALETCVDGENRVFVLKIVDAMTNRQAGEYTDGVLSLE
jgi:hypothetical protein